MTSKKLITGLAATIITVFVLLVGVLNFVERVPEGHVAVVYTPSDGAKEVLTPGWEVIGLFEKTYKFSVRQEVINTKVEVNTSDGKIVTIPVTYNVSIDSAAALDLFKEYGPREDGYYYDTVIQQQLRKLAKERVVTYSTLEIFTDKLTQAGTEVGNELSKSMQPKGFSITDLAFLSPQIDENTQAAIDAQIRAQQENELKKLQLENEKIEADKKAVIAKGEADAKIIQAQGEAQANKELEQSITPELLAKMEAEARIKHGWITITGATPVVQTK